MSCRVTSKHFHLWSEGLEHWRAGRLDLAEQSLRAAVEAAGEGVPWEYRGSLAGVLAQRGALEDAEKQYEEGLASALLEAEESSALVVTARYFLAEHLLVLGKNGDVLAVTSRSCGLGARSESLLRFVRALAFDRLERGDEALQEATAAVDGALSEKQRNRFSSRLRHILDRRPD